ncbi:MAG TPA: hypothetical protein VIN05_05330 [Roseovarius sp.]|uniref:hypothetical protein n=1 Tax=Roseovarius sp. M141 TaxID=2583806 RepID=UPI0020CBBE52|nr:hypothetical protein [Roseovarius sp. M141]MCQ0090422.1 hypothetical protein [Roseovarius sp. M141]
MQWILENWVLLLVGSAMVAMHLFRHGHKDRGHVSHPGCAKRAEAVESEAAISAKDGTNV